MQCSETTETSQETIHERKVDNQEKFQVENSLTSGRKHGRA